jgi:DNA modification methylase
MPKLGVGSTTAKHWPATKVELWPVARIKANPRNPRRHGADQIARIRASLREFGWTMPVLVRETGMLIAGHGRLEAGKLEGYGTIPVLVARGWSEAQCRAYAIADNKLTESSEWDDELLRLELGELRDIGFDLAFTGFDPDELDGLLAPLGDGAGTAGESEDDAADEMPPPPGQPVSRRGDLWLIGEHRLLCGDGTDAGAVARVMDGAQATLLFTSPPYGNQRDYTTGGVGDWNALMRGVFAQLPVGDRAQVLVNLGLIHRENEWQPYWQAWLDWMRDQGWRRFGLYVWDQGPGLPGDWNGRLAPAFELVFHFNRQARRPNKIVPCKWAGHVNDTHGGIRHRDGHVGEWTHAGRGVQDNRIPDNVIRVTRHKARGIETEHPAVFPVALPEFVMRAYSNDGDVIYEPFAGSGTSVVAGERTGRRVRAIELAPQYVDVAILRWQQLFPDKPVLLDGEGLSFETVARQRGVEVARVD